MVFLKRKIKNFKLYLKLFLVFQLIFNSLYVGASNIKFPSQLTHKELDELNRIYQEEGREALIEHPLIEVLDSYNLLNQTVRIKNEEGQFVSLSHNYLYDLKRDFLFEGEIDKVILGKTNKGDSVYIEGLFDEVSVLRQYIQGIGKVISQTTGLQFGVILTDRGLFVVDQKMGVNLVGHSPLPVVQIPLNSNVQDLLKNLQDIQMEFISPDKEFKITRFQKMLKIKFKINL